MHPHTEETQDRRQSSLAAQKAKEVLVKAHFLVTVSMFMGTNPPSWVQSTGGTPLHLLPWCAVSTWQVFATGKLKDRVFQSHPPLVQLNAVWRHWGSVLTFRMSSLAEWDIRILSHQAGHLVFMYCFPWLESSL